MSVLHVKNLTVEDQSDGTMTMMMKTDRGGEEKTDISIRESRLVQVEDPTLLVGGTEERRRDRTIAMSIASGTNVDLERREIMTVFNHFLQLNDQLLYIIGQCYLLYIYPV